MNKNDELIQIQQTLQEIYHINTQYFKTNHPAIYQKVINFEKQHIENYALDFIDDRFQLIDLQTKEHFYKIDPFTQAKQRVNQFSHSQAFSLIKLEPYPKRNHYDNEINAYAYANEFINTISKVPEKINKFIFIGTLLGIHINDFHDYVQAASYLIIEPNLEIFRLSMFMTDYSALAQTSKLYFSIGEFHADFEQTVQLFLNNSSQHNNLIYYELACEKYEHYFKTLSAIFTQQSEMRYPFSEYLISLQRGYNCYFTDNNIINLGEIHPFLNNKPTIFLGAGVSLAKNIEWLYLHQDEFVIVASSAVLKHLQILDIVPDMILMMDGQKECMLTQFDVPSYMYENTIILSSIKIDPTLLDIFDGSLVFYLQNSLELFVGFGYLSGVTVGDIGVDVLAKLGCSQLYLLGVDAALDSQTGKTHIGTHQSSRKVNLQAPKESHSVNFKEEITYVKGNFQKEVPTFLEYTEMISNLEEMALLHQKHTKVYNLSNGAYYHFTTPLQPQDVKFDSTLDKSTLKDELQKQLQSITKKELSTLDINALKKEKKVLKKLNTTLLEYEPFYKEFNKLKKSFSSSIVINILNKYFTLIAPYYFFIEEKDISNKIFKNQIQNILNKFNTIYDKIDTKST